MTVILIGMFFNQMRLFKKMYVCACTYTSDSCCVIGVNKCNTGYYN
jgi:hypothetical protein